MKKTNRKDLWFLRLDDGLNFHNQHLLRSTLFVLFYGACVFGKVKVLETKCGGKERKLNEILVVLMCLLHADERALGIYIIILFHCDGRIIYFMCLFVQMSLHCILSNIPFLLNF